MLQEKHDVDVALQIKTARSARAMPTWLSRRRTKAPAPSKSPRTRFTSAAAAPGCTPSGPGYARANRSLSSGLRAHGRP